MYVRALETLENLCVCSAVNDPFQVSFRLCPSTYMYPHPLMHHAVYTTHTLMQDGNFFDLDGKPFQSCK